MTTQKQTEILNLLDLERQTVVYPGVARFTEAGVVRDVSTDGKSCEIVFSSSSEDELVQVIRHQIQTARNEQYDLEWKVYSHDSPHCLGERLAAAGFESGEREAFMVLIANIEALNCFGNCDVDIRRVTEKSGLADVRIISEEVYKKSFEKQIEQYRFMLENHPNNLSVYVAYVGGEPAACGRIYFHEDSKFAGLFGGQTREQFRKSGLFTQLVGTRIREAFHRGIVNICVDALPTSEPILKKRGFDVVTYTQPFTIAT